MPRKAKTDGLRVTGHGPRATEPAPRFIEIVNWQKAQPTIPDKDAPWVKLYTSLLHHDAFGELDDTSRVLIVALWLYAGQTGRHVFPADPSWLRRKIPLLHSDPDFGPLLAARDAYGEPTPFLRYCASKDGEAEGSEARPQRARATKRTTGTGRRAKEAAPAAAHGGGIVDKTGIYNVHNSTEREREKRLEKENRTLTGSEKKKKEKERVSSSSQDGTRTEKQSQKPEETQAQSHSPRPEQTRREPVNPGNPRESEGGEAVCVHTPKPPPSATSGLPYRLGRIPIWWSDPACVAFSYRIFADLKLHMDPESREGRANRGTFAAWLFETRAQTPMHQWQWLEDEAQAKAREIARYGKAARKPGAVWLDVMSRVLRARAGPAAASG